MIELDLHLVLNENVFNIFFMNENEKKGILISDPEAREHVYGMPYSEWKKKYQK